MKTWSSWGLRSSYTRSAYCVLTVR
uniref:Uncharacterized protein n=1 Tax=Arundo donax TaxID=35708 RepID=A0A0A8YLD8_ARUDO